MAEFGAAYEDQYARDHRRLVSAAKKERIEAKWYRRSPKG
jgi:hypothetical protein